jgi:nucleoid DNA-binding protein
MNQLVSHIEFLLHEHNCVIIPDFGGFVVNIIPSRRDGIATFHAPLSELVFNRDLTHNDGLLAQSYMKSYTLTFEAAMQKIERAVQELKQQLREQNHVELGKLGSFTMNDSKRFVYTPAAFVQPAFFGLKKASLRPLIQMHTPVVPSKQVNRQKRLRTIGISAAAVAAIALLMFILPVSDTTLGRQSAQIISESGLFRSKPAQTDHLTAAATDKTNESLSGEEVAILAEEMLASSATTSAQVIDNNMPQYYIVLGVYERSDVAEQITVQLINEGFSQTEWLKRPGRIDVYSASFTDKMEAETYLREIHKKHPTHRDAWILKR